MLRGLDRVAGADDDPVMVKVDGRSTLNGELTVYLRESPPSYVHDRQNAVLEVLGALESAGVVRDVPVVRWPEQVREAGETEAPALDIYETFRDSVGRESLEPFFEEKPAAGADERVVVLPVICVALRSDRELTGLYPRWENGTHHSIEDCLNALTAGESIENVEH
jgi:hypothetical protein